MAYDKEDNRHFIVRHAGTIFTVITALVITVTWLENRKLVALNKELADLNIRKLKGGAAPLAEGGPAVSAKVT